MAVETKTLKVKYFQAVDTNCFQHGVTSDSPSFIPPRVRVLITSLSSDVDGGDNLMSTCTALPGVPPWPSPTRCNLSRRPWSVGHRGGSSSAPPPSYCYVSRRSRGVRRHTLTSLPWHYSCPRHTVTLRKSTERPPSAQRKVRAPSFQAKTLASTSSNETTTR